MRIPFAHGKAVLVASAVLTLMLAGSISAAHEGEGFELSVQYDSLDRTLLQYSISGFDQRIIPIDGTDHLAISIPHTGFVSMHASGQPQLPVLTQSIMIPDDARMEVRVLDGEYYEIEDVNIAPYKGPIARTVDPASVPYTFGGAYGEDAWFPGELASLRDPYIMRDVRGVVVEVFPFQYHPGKKVLRVYERISVAVEAAGPGEKNVIDRATYGHKPDQNFESIYKTYFPNYGGNRTEPPPESGDLLIIAYGAFMADMQPFVDWKNSIGINTTMVDVATIGNDATKIKNYITNVYNSGNLGYVLLVGDYAQITCGSYSYGPSDPNYSTINYDWYPDIFVGRFSAQKPEHVQTQVERTLQYEQEGHDVSMGGWNARGLGVASNQGPGHYGEYDDDHEDLIRDELLNYGFNEVDRSYDPWGTKAMIAASINTGVRCVNYTGHGGPTGWGNGGSFSNTDVHNLVNTGMLPWITSVACNVGEFTYSECFHEAWQWATYNGKPAGAIVGYGSSIGQYWDEPMYGQGNHCYNNQLGAVDRFWTETNWSACGCFFGGSCIMMDICGQSGRDMFMTWIFFGDPTLRLTGEPGDQTLIADAWAIPLNAPVDIHFTICPDASYAGYKYVLLTGATGTSPGTLLPGGLEVPLNFDVLTYFVLANMNPPTFQNFMGTLDGNGQATATFSTQGLTPFDPRFAGVKLYFAAVLWPAGGAYEFATNAKMLSFVE